MWQMLRKSLSTGVVTETVDRPAVPGELAAELDEKVKRLFGRSLHLRHVDTGSCNACDFELTALLNPLYDLQRFGFDFVASPRHADLLVVTGPVTHNLRTALLRTVEATPRPRLILALGDCACQGGPSAGSYATCGGAGGVVPVGLCIPGCPPSPERIIRGLLTAFDRL